MRVQVDVHGNRYLYLLLAMALDAVLSAGFCVLHVWKLSILILWINHDSLLVGIPGLRRRRMDITAECGRASTMRRCILPGFPGQLYVLSKQNTMVGLTIYQYTCYDGNFLCPVLDGEATLKCGNDCYKKEMYSYGGSLITV